MNTTTLPESNTFRFSHFLIIGLCNFSHDRWVLEIISELYAIYLCVVEDCFKTYHQMKLLLLTHHQDIFEMYSARL